MKCEGEKVWGVPTPNSVEPNTSLVKFVMAPSNKVPSPPVPSTVFKVPPGSRTCKERLAEIAGIGKVVVEGVKLLHIPTSPAPEATEGEDVGGEVVEREGGVIKSARGGERVLVLVKEEGYGEEPSNASTVGVKKGVMVRGAVTSDDKVEEGDWAVIVGAELAEGGAGVALLQGLPVLVPPKADAVGGRRVLEGARELEGMRVCTE